MRSAEDIGWEVYVAFTAGDMTRGCEIIGRTQAEALAEGRRQAFEEARVRVQDVIDKNTNVLTRAAGGYGVLADLRDLASHAGLAAKPGGETEPAPPGGKEPA